MRESSLRIGAGWRAALALLALATGCAKPVVIVLPAMRDTARDEDKTRPSSDCRYLTLLVSYTAESPRMTTADVKLSAQVAEAMRSEFEQLGMKVVDQPTEAYWSLMVMATEDVRNDGFIFGATLSLRQFHEHRDAGLSGYSGVQGTGDSKTPPTLYTGLSYGAEWDLERFAREFVQRADAALLPAERALCSQSSGEETRELSVEQKLPVPL